MTRFSEAGDSAPNRTARLSAGRSSSSCSPITAPGQVPELGPARVQEPEREPEREPTQGLGQALQAQGPACWRPAAQPGRGHARRRFCQRHNTQQWPG
ncbi:hypothetical protein MPL3356_40082 [Mesorhizobium plurifarium]|uniref:Uncharacterized protein n=1 Tax=Mesorhizobium plurifarium TaxID=69974 RepID=A0A090E045_MESPL|nr:hypothetical protein MPL3356_40082 [Mesorhizobium plurifarium]